VARPLPRLPGGLTCAVARAQEDFAVLGALCKGNWDIVSRDREDATWIVNDLVDNGSPRFFLYSRATKTATLLFLARPELEKFTLVPMQALEPPNPAAFAKKPTLFRSPPLENGNPDRPPTPSPLSQHPAPAPRPAPPSRAAPPGAPRARGRDAPRAPRAQSHVIEASDGEKLVVFVTLPAGVPPAGLPTVLLVHGGPWARDHWGWNPQAQWLANRGYACVQVNFRCVPPRVSTSSAPLSAAGRAISTGEGGTQS